MVQFRCKLGAIPVQSSRCIEEEDPSINQVPPSRSARGVRGRSEGLGRRRARRSRCFGAHWGGGKVLFCGARPSHRQGVPAEEPSPSPPTPHKALRGCRVALCCGRISYGGSGKGKERR